MAVNRITYICQIRFKVDNLFDLRQRLAAVHRASLDLRQSHQNLQLQTHIGIAIGLLAGRRAGAVRRTAAVGGEVGRLENGGARVELGE